MITLFIQDGGKMDILLKDELQRIYDFHISRARTATKTSDMEFHRGYYKGIELACIFNHIKLRYDK